jgi:FlaA1/EpsC-like NDP-sugar epimerase
MIIYNVLEKVLGRKQSMFSIDLGNNSNKLSENIENKKLLVIGGAGTIGSSFIKAALVYKPAKLVVVDINENGLTELVRDLRSSQDQFIPQELITYPVSFANPVFKKIFIAHGPFDIVANFAAHKHVRSEKDIYSIEALVQNNLINAKDVLDLLVDFPPEHFFCVSTDKAANPVNIMGASKKMMEEMILSYSKKFKISTARFANVAFSNGSLLDGFLRRIEKEQPLSCPSDVTRFFVTPRESGEICLMACILGNTSEIFFPKLNMVQDLINFSNIYPTLLNEMEYEAIICNSEIEARNSMYLLKQKKYPVHLFKTDTSGEKLYEEFYTETESFSLDRFNALGVISKKAIYDLEEINSIISELLNLLEKPGVSKSDIVNWLKKYIPEFDHIETGLTLDNKM